MSQRITAHAAAAEISTIGELPTNLQWMPPGKRMVQPMNFPEAFEINVTPQMAALADSQLQMMLADFQSGTDVQPYLDINHKDEVKAFLPSRIAWGGDDEKTGGIRIEGQWNAVGVKAAKEEGLNVISPSWALDKFSKEFLGIKRNMGGLVPRSAFYSIQAFARASDTPVQPQVEHAFVVMAKVYGEQHKIADPVDAQTAFSKTPAGNKQWADYCQWIVTQPPIEANARPAVPVRTATPFEAQARAYGAERGIHDQVNAQMAFAATPQGNAVYAAYCKSFR